MEELLTEDQQASLWEKGIDWTRITYVTAVDALDALARGNALLVDTRRADMYADGHFPGAVHKRGPEHMLTLPRDKALYFYCT